MKSQLVTPADDARSGSCRSLTRWKPVGRGRGATERCRSTHTLRRPRRRRLDQGTGIETHGIFIGVVNGVSTRSGSLVLSFSGIGRWVLANVGSATHTDWLNRPTDAVYTGRPRVVRQIGDRRPQSHLAAHDEGTIEQDSSRVTAWRRSVGCIPRHRDIDGLSGAGCTRPRAGVLDRVDVGRFRLDADFSEGHAHNARIHRAADISLHGQPSGVPVDVGGAGRDLREVVHEREIGTIEWFRTFTRSPNDYRDGKEEVIAILALVVLTPVPRQRLRE